MQPGGELGLPAKLPDPPDELHEGLLRRVLRVVGIAKDVERDPVDPLGVPCAEGFEGEVVSISGAPNEDRV
jgi:hypothetical protein